MLLRVFMSPPDAPTADEITADIAEMLSRPAADVTSTISPFSAMAAPRLYIDDSNAAAKSIPSHKLFAKSVRESVAPVAESPTPSSPSAVPSAARPKPSMTWALNSSSPACSIRPPLVASPTLRSSSMMLFNIPISPERAWIFSASSAELKSKRLVSSFSSFILS